MRNLEIEPQSAGLQKRVVEGFRLSPQQKRVWSLQRTDGSAPYRAECTVLIEGLCDTSILGAALHEVWERNEILRTGFVCLPGIEGPVQVIKEGPAPAIYSYDLTGRERSHQEGRIDALRRKASELSFDFEQGRIARISLVTLSPAVHIALFNLSSLCADLLSLGNLVREICHAYLARLERTALGDQPAQQYADLAQWQNELLESQDTNAGRNYWRTQNFPDSVALKLPCESQFTANRHFQPRRLVSTIDSRLTGQIESLARTHDSSASVLLLACWQTLLWRLTGVSDFSIGMACDGRSYEELQRALGPFSKNLALRCHVDGEPPFSKLLRRVDEAVREALEWQEYFRWEGVWTGQGSNRARSDGAGSNGAGLNGQLEAAPFFAAGFEFRERPGKHCAAGLTFSLRELSACSDRFNLKLCCVEAEDSFAAEFHHDSNLFGAADVRRLSEQFRTLVESVLGNPQAAVGELAILNGAQRQQLITEFNNSAAVYPEDKLVHQLFEEQVERTSHAVAIVFEHRQLTYFQLNARANQLAHHLKALGVGPEVPVAICMERCPEMVVGLLGILKAGGAYVPLDPAYPKERLSFMLEDSLSRVLLTQGRIAAAMPAHRAQVVCLDSGCEAIDRASEQNPVNAATPGNLAYVIYTSGSTGLPKGVMIEHGSLTNYLCWIGQGPMGEALAHLPLTTKLTFDMCLKQLFPPLLRGREIWMLPEEVTAEPAALLSALGTRGRFGLNCVPTLWKAMLQAMESGHAAIPREDFAYLLFGGEQLSQDLVESSFTAFPHLQIWNIYGPTEATANACAVTIGSGDDVTIGRPISNAQIYILDSSLRPVPIGVQGELFQVWPAAISIGRI